MALALNYSSDEDEINKSIATDAFGLSSLPQAKKPRFDEAPSTSSQTTAAPDVLSEVGASSSRRCRSNRVLGSLEPQVVGY